MGSLFDGIGGFPLAAVRNGIEPLWASEIEAFPIEVTKTHFPNMLHVGDITKLDGAKLPPVDIICGGSPCQDLSVAGARAGLAGDRSGLFMEQIRVIREMRNADRDLSFEYTGQDQAVVEISLNNGNPIVNELLLGTIQGMVAACVPGAQ